MENFITNIKNLELSRILLQLKYILNKRHKNEQHLEFLFTAKSHNIIPKFLQIKLPKNKFNTQESHNIYLSLLRKEIKKQFKTRNLIHLKLKFLHRHLLQLLHPIEYDVLIQDLTYEIIDMNMELDYKRKKKLQKLITNMKNQIKETQQLHQRKHTTNTTTEDQQPPHIFPERITNLTDTQFNNEETSLFNLGHKFAPPPKKPSKLSLAIDIESQLHRNHPDCINIKRDIGNILNCKVSNVKDNNTSPNSTKIQNTIKSIKHKIKNNNLIITSADKNAGLVIIKKDEYIKKTEQFFQSNNVTKLKSNPIKSFIIEVNKTLSFCRPTLLKFDSDIIKLKNRNAKTPILYSLIKLHKPDKSIRPITSCINSPTQKIAKFINHIFTHILKYTSPHSVLNSNKLIQNLQNIMPTNQKFIMASFDITNLYTNIPIQQTIHLITNILYSNSDLVSKYNLSPIDIENLISLTQLTTEQNFFNFNDCTYKMEDGLPMGSPISGLLANIYIDNLEKEIEKLPDFNNVLAWFRYVDDILCLWKKDITSIHHFHHIINNISNIKFTIEIETNNQINFLDLTLIRTNSNDLKYEIYRKPTSTDIIIPHNSYHSPQIKTSAFNFLFHRLLQTPLDQKSYQKELDIIKLIGRNNQYTPEYIQKLYHKTRKKLTLKLIYPNISTRNRYISIPYFHEYHKMLHKTLNTHEYNTIAKSHPTLAKILSNNKPTENPLEKSGIYKIKCKNCEAHYIGLTTRNITTRFKEHKNNRPKSALGTHLIEHKHDTDLNHTQLLHHSNNFAKLCILEHFEIEKHKIQNPHTLLNETTNFPSLHIYNHIFPFQKNTNIKTRNFPIP